jgi:hypothetical protein
MYRIVNKTIKYFCALHLLDERLLVSANIMFKAQMFHLTDNVIAATEKNLKMHTDI